MSCCPCLEWDNSCQHSVQHPWRWFKRLQSGLEKKFKALGYQTHFSKESWSYVYTDGSAEEAVPNRGAVYFQYPRGREVMNCLANGLSPTNYKAKGEALNNNGC